MATLLDYRRRIRSVRQTQQMTRAMKFVAAAQLRRAQARVFAARPYAQEILRVLRSAAARMEAPAHPLLDVRPVQRILLVAVSADKGLCGPFNANLIRAALQFLQEHREQQPQVIGVGRKVCHALRRQGWRLLAEYVDLFRRVEMAHARQLASQIAEVYLAGQADAVYVVYNEFKSVLRQQIVVETLLPLSPEVVEAPRGRLPDYIYEDPPEVIFARLLPRYLDAEVFRILLESAAGEQAARMTAMDAATSNAADLIDQLTLEMNKVRQASITKEIIEVVSGAAATGR
jgi:F-type H+-transporting ATPase subunit gamma